MFQLYFLALLGMIKRSRISVEGKCFNCPGLGVLEHFSREKIE